MKRILQFLLFLMAFQMEVRVKASVGVLQQPDLCLGGPGQCALHVTEPAFHFEKNNIKFHASKGTALLRLAPESWRLLTGALWVEQGSSLKVETLYAEVQASRGSYWLLQDERLVVRNMDAEISIILRDGRTITIPEGFEVWIGGIDSQGQTETGVLRPIEMSEHLPLWARVFKGPKQDFIAQVQQLKKRWGDLVSKSSQIYKGSIERRLAAEEAEKQALRQRQAQAEAERQRVRELFFYRTFHR